MPMIRQIPHRLEFGWRQEAANYTGAELPPLNAEPEPLPECTRFAFILASAIASFLIFSVRGVSTDLVFQAGFVLCVLLLAFINVETQILPDQVSLTVMWIGLVYQSVRGKGADQISGAALGYMVPYVISLVWRFLAKKEFVGGGDMKVFAMAGAWVGLKSMPTLFVVFCISGAVIGVVAKLTDRTGPNGFISTGPMHFLASLAVVLGFNFGSPWY